MIEARAASVPVARRPHPGGAKGAMLSLDEVAKRAWAARGDPRVRAWTTQKLDACGRPTGKRAQMQCIVDAYRKAVPYVNDPLQVEAMYGPVQTLCLDPNGICIVGGDCDDTSITLAACLMSVGMRVAIVGASYADPNVPTHVYIAAQDDAGGWVRIDGTTDFTVGSVHGFVKEWWVDPASGISADGLSGGEFVGVGRAGAMQEQGLSFGGRSVVGFGLGFGLGLTTPGDVLLYRNMWDDYVLDTVRVCQSCSAEYASLAQSESNAAAKDAENALSVSIGKMGDALLAQWNIFAAKSDDFIVLNGANILETFQGTVQSAGSVRGSLQSDHCPMSFIAQDGSIQTPSPGPDTSLQVQVISRIEGLGILGAGILQIMVGTAEGTIAVVGSAAQWAGQQVTKAASVLSQPGLWVAVVLVVGGALAVYYVPRRRS